MARSLARGAALCALIAGLGAGSRPSAASASSATVQAGAATTDQLLARLAIETAGDGDLPPIQVSIDRTPQFAVYDRFRLAALAARASLRAGHPLDPDHPPADLLQPRLIVLAFARTPRGGDAPRPQAVRLTDKDGHAIRQTGIVKTADLAALLPGVDVPPLTLAVAFPLASLRPSDRITIVFNELDHSLPVSGMPAGGMMGTFAGGVVFKAPTIVTQRPPDVPDGVTVAPGANTVNIEGVLDLAGRVRYARVVDGPSDLRAAALAAVSAWQYEPARMWGAPVPLVMQAAVTFPVRYPQAPQRSF
jgi:hypothetical protein